MVLEQHALSLPVSIVSPTDVARLAREIETLDSFFREQQIRTGGNAQELPRMSKLLDQLAADNKLNILQENDRALIKQQLDELHKHAPVMHISFSVDPPGSYVQKIVDWLRSNIDKRVLVTVGLQPNIGAGCVVRTTNKLFDFSLREYFTEKRPFFISKLHGALTDGDTDLLPAPPAPPTVQIPTVPAAVVSEAPTQGVTA